MGLFGKKPIKEAPKVINSEEDKHIQEYKNEFSKLMNLKSEFDAESSIVGKVLILEKMIYKIYGLKALKRQYDLNPPPIESLLDSLIEMRKSYMAYFENGESEYNFVHTKIVGVTFNNDDGQNRQDLLHYMDEGELLQLIPYEYEGEPAVKVLNSIDEQLGNLSKEFAGDFYNKIKNERIKLCFARNLTGDYDENSLGCNLLIIFSD